MTTGRINQVTIYKIYTGSLFDQYIFKKKGIFHQSTFKKEGIKIYYIPNFYIKNTHTFNVTNDNVLTLIPFIL